MDVLGEQTGFTLHSGLPKSHGQKILLPEKPFFKSGNSELRGRTLYPFLEIMVVFGDSKEGLAPDVLESRCHVF